MARAKGRKSKTSPPEEPNRPTKHTEFTQDIADRICELIADGKSLRSICLADDMPDKSTVFKWLSARSDFDDQYGRAREAQADSFAEDSVDIADDGTRDYVTDSGGNPVVNHDHIARARLRVDTRKWAAGKLRPKKYGDRLLTETQHLDKDGNPADLPVYGICYPNGAPGQPLDPTPKRTPAEDEPAEG